MALAQCGVGLFFLVATAAASMFCPKNLWDSALPGDITVGLEPFASMTSPHCCDRLPIRPPPPPLTDAELQVKCHLCYNLTRSTPGFARDPHDCTRYHICEPNGEGGFNTFHMQCPLCSFWNQTELSCVQVWFNTEYCVQTGHQTDPPVTAAQPLMFCIDFEDDDLIMKGTPYQPWVLNRGVTVVTSSECPQGNRCGFFNESLLEVPMFSNNYDPWHGLKITLKYKQTLSSTMDQGVISNDCINGQSGAPGNSLYCSVDGNGNAFNAGLKSPPASASDSSSLSVWQSAEMDWNGAVLSVRAGGPGSSAPFEGPIRNSHCPLVIGAFIKEQAETYFQGYMDEICFYKW